MDTENKRKHSFKRVDKLSEEAVKPNTNEGQSEEKPAKKTKRKATQEQLNHPLHGVKLVQILESLVECYGWAYLADRVKIRCFMYNPTMKSSLGFLRKTTWAREHVEDIYIEMLEEGLKGQVKKSATQPKLH